MNEGGMGGGGMGMKGGCVILCLLITDVSMTTYGMILRICSSNHFFF